MDTGSLGEQSQGNTNIGCYRNFDHQLSGGFIDNRVSSNPRHIGSASGDGRQQNKMSNVDRRIETARPTSASENNLASNCNNNSPSTSFGQQQPNQKYHDRAMTVTKNNSCHNNEPLVVMESSTDHTIMVQSDNNINNDADDNNPNRHSLDCTNAHPNPRSLSSKSMASAPTTAGCHRLSVSIKNPQISGNFSNLSNVFYLLGCMLSLTSNFNDHI